MSMQEEINEYCYNVCKKYNWDFNEIIKYPFDYSTITIYEQGQIYAKRNGIKIPKKLISKIELKTILKDEKEKLEIEKALIIIKAYCEDGETARIGEFLSKNKLFLSQFNKSVALVKSKCPEEYKKWGYILENKSKILYKKAKNDIDNLSCNLKSNDNYKILDYYLTKPVFSIRTLMQLAQDNIPASDAQPISIYAKSFSGNILNKKNIYDSTLIKKVGEEEITITKEVKEKVITAIEVNQLPQLQILYSQLLDYYVKGIVSINDDYSITDNRIKVKERKREQ